jgi:hypothetical protein
MTGPDRQERSPHGRKSIRDPSAIRDGAIRAKVVVDDRSFDHLPGRRGIGQSMSITRGSAPASFTRNAETSRCSRLRATSTIEAKSCERRIAVD